MDDNQSSYFQILVFPVLIAVVAAAWFVVGPGSQALAGLGELSKSWIDQFAVWYQKSLDGFAKILAPIVTILSGAYAINKSIKFAESRLQYRLQDFLKREETRLKDAREKLRATIERPGPDRTFRAPLFLASGLKRAVYELGWGSYFLPPQLDYTDFQVSSSLIQLKDQLERSTERHQHLGRQLATAHLLRGAILAAKATELERQGKQSRSLVIDALQQFTAAYEAEKDDVDALEYASHMHMRLGQDTQADRLINRVLTITENETKSLPRARAFRYRALLLARAGRNGLAEDAIMASLAALPVRVGIDREEEAEIYDLLAKYQQQQGAVRLAAGNRANAAAIRKEVQNARAESKSWWSGTAGRRKKAKRSASSRNQTVN